MLKKGFDPNSVIKRPKKSWIENLLKFQSKINPHSTTTPETELRIDFGLIEEFENEITIVRFIS